MRHAALFLRSTAPLCHRHVLALRPTSTLFIPPQLVRLIVAGGVFLFQVFLTAHQRAAKRLQEEDEANRVHAAADVGGYGTRKATSMSPVEALQVLGLDSSLPVPLQHETDRQEATRRFLRLFAIAKEMNNVYLEGKFSAAYRLCVDAQWDARDDSSNNGSNNYPRDEGRSN